MMRNPSGKDNRIGIARNAQWLGRGNAILATRCHKKADPQVGFH